MAPDRGRDADGPPFRAVCAPRGWALRWPARAVWPVLLVDAAAAVLLVVGLLREPVPTAQEVGFAAAVLLLAVVQTEASVWVERERRRLGEVEHVDLTAVWTFAGAVVLPAPYAALVAVVVVFHLWVRAWRTSVPLHRQVHAAATVALACIVTAALLESLSGPRAAHHDLWVLVAAVLTFTAVSTCLTAAGPAAWPQLATILARRDERVVEFGLRCLGALAAVTLTTSPWTVLFVLPPLLVLLRAVLIRPLVAAASTDGKTGLLNASAWYAEAGRVLRSPAALPRACGVLVVDLDHFKAVNDTHGHVVGDRVLTAVADVLRDGVRGHDVVGRLGGEEFVVLPVAAVFGTRAVELEVVAERIRARVAALRVEVGPLVISDLSVSVGGAVAPQTGTDLAALLQTADAALYAAKGAGRNRVRIEVAPPARPVRVPLPGAGQAAD